MADKRDLKVLHIFNIATVGQTLAKYQRSRGIQSDVYTRQVSNLPGAIKVFPDTHIDTGKSSKLFVLKAILKARKYNVIHVHFFDRLVPLLKKVYRGRKKVILTYHGSDIREKWGERGKYFHKADLVTVATPDLMENAPKDVIYVPNIVDESLFQRSNSFIPGTILHVNGGKGHEEALKTAKITAKELGLHLVVLDRSRNLIPYDIIPRFMELFEFYDEVKVNLNKGEGWLYFLSLTALQMLELGGKVHFYGEIITSLPKQHNPQHVTEKWLELYQS